MSDHRPQHAKLRDAWVPPEIPAGYDYPVAILDPRGEALSLDVFRARGAVLASEDPAEDLPTPKWPWVEGYDPTPSDWEHIGFAVWK